MFLGVSRAFGVRMKNYALLFPGQGSQYVGMGKGYLAIASCSKLFDEAQDLLSIPLKRLMFEGPIDELTNTAIAQPAILLHSLAAFYYWQEQSSAEISCAIGHSLGEYSALVSAEVLSFGDAIRAVHVRGKLMQEATPLGFGAMAAIIGMEPKAIEQCLADFSDESSRDYVSCANFNGPLQTVIAGTSSGVKKASEKLKAHGAKRVVDLVVSAPFHCALMKPVQKKMMAVLSAIEFKDASFPIISNVSAKEETKGERIRELLIEQIASPVRFTDCISFVNKNELSGCGFLELGPKDTLSSLVKKIDRDAISASMDSPEEYADINV